MSRLNDLFGSSYEPIIEVNRLMRQVLVNYLFYVPAFMPKASQLSDKPARVSRTKKPNKPVCAKRELPRYKQSRARF